jgi:tRNA(Phe) wybutosine-synthesizing methylase Tyw3
MTREYTIKKLYDAIENHYVDEVLIPYLKKYNKLKNTLQPVVAQAEY